MRGVVEGTVIVKEDLGNVVGFDLLVFIFFILWVALVSESLSESAD